MKAKWYFCTLFFILALLGFSEQQLHLPNQEIVVQFADDEVTANEAETAITIVKEQLQSIGVNNIQVRESSGGRLKITYYSDVDVDIIKAILSKEKSLELGYTSYDEDKEPSGIPSEENTNSYKLKISEIQTGYDVTSYFNGCILELTQKHDRLLNPVVYFSATNDDNQQRKDDQKIAFILQRNIALAIDNSSRKIPEVRAGPAFAGNV